MAPGAEPRRAADAVGYHELEADPRPVGSPERRALGVAGDDRVAVDAVGGVIERIGYDAVRLDSLRAGRLLEPGGRVFGASLRRAEFESALRAQAAGGIAFHRPKHTETERPDVNRERSEVYGVR
jgi:predicted dinucleotide-binding enzyme